MTVGPQAQIVELRNQNGNQVRYTVADGTAISKGILLVLSDPRTAAAAGNVLITAPTGAFAGIASADKEASDGSTSLGAWTNGIFDIRASGAIAVGQKVVSAGNNEVKAAESLHMSSSYAIIVGTALETASDAEVINVDIGRR